MPENTWQRQMKWAFCVAQDFRLNDPDFRRQALEAACAIMRPARENVETIVSRLTARGNDFVAQEYAHVPPKTDTADWTAELESQGVYIPIALQAWLIEVGSVNLMGTDRDWPRAGYVGKGKGDAWSTDPLVVETNKEVLSSDFENWKWQCDSDGFDEVGPFSIEFAPDDLHKANISGGSPYALQTVHRSVDSLVLNERHCFSFVAYIRHAFAWGGFPGFEIIDDAPTEFIEEMRTGLEPI